MGVSLEFDRAYGSRMDNLSDDTIIKRKIKANENYVEDMALAA